MALKVRSILNEIQSESGCIWREDAIQNITQL